MINQELPADLIYKISSILVDENGRYSGKISIKSIEDIIVKVLGSKKEFAEFKRQFSKNKTGVKNSFNLVSYFLKNHFDNVKGLELCEVLLNFENSKKIKEEVSEVKIEQKVNDFNDILVKEEQVGFSAYYDYSSSSYKIGNKITLGKKSVSYIVDFILNIVDQTNTGEKSSKKIVLDFFNKIDNSSAEEYDKVGNIESYVESKIKYCNKSAYMNVILKKMFDPIVNLNYDTETSKEIVKFSNLLTKESGYFIDDTEKYCKFNPTGKLLLSEEQKGKIYGDVLNICDKFVEMTEKHLYKSFYFDAHCQIPLAEPKIQAIFRALASLYCEYKYNNEHVDSKYRYQLDLNPEADASQGRVDFKVSRGGGDANVGIVELKLSSSDIGKTIKGQIPIYCKNMNVSRCVLLIVNLEGKDFITDEKKKCIEVLIKEAQEEIFKELKLKCRIDLIIADARKNEDASKIDNIITHSGVVNPKTK